MIYKNNQLDSVFNSEFVLNENVTFVYEIITLENQVLNKCIARFSSTTLISFYTEYISEYIFPFKSNSITPYFSLVCNDYGTIDNINIFLEYFFNYLFIPAENNLLTLSPYYIKYSTSYAEIYINTLSNVIHESFQSEYSIVNDFPFNKYYSQIFHNLLNNRVQNLKFTFVCNNIELEDNFSYFLRISSYTFIINIVLLFIQIIIDFIKIFLHKK